MSNYLSSEIYRVFHSKQTYFLIAALAVSAVLLENLMAVMAVESIGTRDIFYAMFDGINFIYFLCIIIVSVVFAEESKIHTLKNTISYGISKREIYFGRLVVELIVAFICFVSALGAYIAGAYLLFPDSGIVYTIQFIKSMTAAVPIFILCMVFTHALYYCLDNETMILIMWIIVIYVLPKILSALASKVELAGVIEGYMPWYALSNIIVNKKTGDYILGWLTNEGIIKSLLVGIIGSVVCCTIGLISFKRKEIK